LDVLIDTPAERGVWQGRTYADAPDIDGAVFVSGEAIGPGEMLPVEIVARRGYDLVGVVSSEE